MELIDRFRDGPLENLWGGGGVAGEVQLILLILRLENSPRPPTPPP